MRSHRMFGFWLMRALIELFELLFSLLLAHQEYSLGKDLVWLPQYFILRQSDFPDILSSWLFFSSS